jgi:tRNA nucleotidyltransferase (CCA-adding enzyme)
MSINLSNKLKNYLPEPVFKLVDEAGRKSDELGQSLYLVGGVVRDLLLDRGNFDLDLVVEGDAVKLAFELAKQRNVRLTVHHRFGTARLNYDEFSVDFATARSEMYRYPGALPTVRPGTITDDLSRRDFSINALALCLSPDRFGELIDVHNGRQDITRRLVRILHSESFVDDATRMFRAVRYEQRLGFELEKTTAQLLRRDLTMIDTISGDRLRHELELILKETYPERVLKRADELGILGQLHISLRADDWLCNKFAHARHIFQRGLSPLLYLCLIIYNLNEKDAEEFIARLNFPSRSAGALRQTRQLKLQLPVLGKARLKSSAIYHLLHPYINPAIQANLVASESAIISRRMNLYLSRLKSMKPWLTGEDLVAMGIPSGPGLGKILAELHDARLDGEIKTREEEERLVRELSGS